MCSLFSAFSPIHNALSFSAITVIKQSDDLTQERAFVMNVKLTGMGTAHPLTERSRQLAFMRAASVLRSFPFEIRDAQKDLTKVKNIGPHALRVAQALHFYSFE